MERVVGVGKRRTCVQLISFVMVGVCIYLSSVPAFAQSKSAIGVSLEHKKVTLSADNKEVLAPADQAKPSDIIQYTAIYTNQSDGVVRGLHANLPIPAGMTYLEDSANPKPVKASVDGVHFGNLPLKRLERLPDGKEVEREIPLAEYRMLQWVIGEMKSGESTTVTARVRVNPTPAAP